MTTERYRKNARVILSLILGTGIYSMELGQMVGTQIAAIDAGTVVRVSGSRARKVTVRRMFEREVAEIGRRAGDELILLPERTRSRRHQVSNFIEECSVDAVPKLNTRRLRCTWIVAHLAARTDIGVLAAAAGVHPEALGDYRQFLPDVPDEAAQQMLRGV